MDKWQGMMQVLFEVQLHHLAPFGFPTTDLGLRAFTAQYNALMRSDPRGATLAELGIARWKTAASIAFNVDDGSLTPMSRETARTLSNAITTRMHSDAFLTLIDAAVV